MKNSLIFDPTLSEEELRGFSRTVAEIEWLTVILVLLYQVIFSPDPETSSNLALGTLLFAGFVLSFHYLNFYRKESNWKIAIETWVMIAFITWVLMQTGRLESPLINLYLLVIITTALTLGKAATLLQIALIAACYLWLAEAATAESMVVYYAGIAAQFAPMVLVAYITTMLSSDIRRALTHIKMLSEKDELTGVLNMRAFGTIAERISRQAARYNHTYTIIMVDSDSLKVVNDKYGHQAGNRLLQLLVQCIQAQLRETDVLARYGGDEFVVLLPETAAAGAEIVATRIRERVEAAVLTTRERPVSTTVSMGIASYPEHGSDLESVMERADQALYASKTGGRNRVSVAPGRVTAISAAG
ncbi:MAG TPA: GGDEF domain-containing protein [Burkholderiales bacterium]|nr:GGDEF domain-containing protein [Burkholderiales bacterium]